MALSWKICWEVSYSLDKNGSKQWTIDRVMIARSSEQCWCLPILHIPFNETEAESTIQFFFFLSCIFFAASRLKLPARDRTIASTCRNLPRRTSRWRKLWTRAAKCELCTRVWSAASGTASGWPRPMVKWPATTPLSRLRSATSGFARKFRALPAGRVLCLATALLCSKVLRSAFNRSGLLLVFSGDLREI